VPELPANLVRLARSSRGLTLYFPPLRTPAAAFALALFGAACLTLALLAGIALAPLAYTGPAGVLAIWMMSIFLLPFAAFGVAFLALAAYQVANSLTVEVDASGLRSVRRVLGIATARRSVAREDVTAIDAIAVQRHRLPREAAAYYSLIARTRSGAGLTLAAALTSGRLADYRNRRIVVAESLRDEALMEEIRREVLLAARLEHLAAP